MWLCEMSCDTSPNWCDLCLGLLPLFVCLFCFVFMYVLLLLLKQWFRYVLHKQLPSVCCIVQFSPYTLRTHGKINRSIVKIGEYTANKVSDFGPPPPNFCGISAYSPVFMVYLIIHQSQSSCGISDDTLAFVVFLQKFAKIGIWKSSEFWDFFFFFACLSLSSLYTFA